MQVRSTICYSMVESMVALGLSSGGFIVDDHFDILTIFDGL